MKTLHQDSLLRVKDSLSTMPEAISTVPARPVMIFRLALILAAAVALAGCRAKEISSTDRKEAAQHSQRGRICGHAQRTGAGRRVCMSRRPGFARTRGKPGSA